MKKIGVMIIMACCASCVSTSDIEVVSDFDIDRYMGEWYEAARYPHRFEEGLISVTAKYVKRSNGTIRVINHGYDTQHQKWSTIEGVAKPKSKDSLGWLKVSFFWPFHASYKIIYLDEEYTRAIVTGHSRRYLWILVRDPTLPKKEIDALISKAEDLGFDTDKLLLVDQSKNKS